MAWIKLCTFVTSKENPLRDREIMFSSLMLDYCCSVNYKWKEGEMRIEAKKRNHQNDSASSIEREEGVEEVRGATHSLELGPA